MEKQNTYERALLRLQEDYPDQWHLFVNKATRNIKAAMRKHKLELSHQGLREAVSHCLTIADGAATVLTYYAAAGIMQKLDDLEKEHVAIELREINIETQQIKLKEVNWSDQDKKEVGDFYSRRMDAVKIRLSQIIAEVTALGKSLGVPPPVYKHAKWVPQPRRPFGHWGNRGGAVSA